MPKRKNIVVSKFNIVFYYKSVFHPLNLLLLFTFSIVVSYFVYEKTKIALL